MAKFKRLPSGGISYRGEKFTGFNKLKKLHQGVRKSFLFWLNKVIKSKKLGLVIGITKILGNIKIPKGVRLLGLGITVLLQKIN